jgi:hypothetical protein
MKLFRTSAISYYKDPYGVPNTEYHSPKDVESYVTINHKLYKGETKDGVKFYDYTHDEKRYYYLLAISEESPIFNCYIIMGKESESFVHLGVYTSVADMLVKNYRTPLVEKYT